MGGASLLHLSDSLKPVPTLRAEHAIRPRPEHTSIALRMPLDLLSVMACKHWQEIWPSSSHALLLCMSLDHKADNLAGTLLPIVCVCVCTRAAMHAVDPCRRICQVWACQRNNTRGQLGPSLHSHSASGMTHATRPCPLPQRAPEQPHTVKLFISRCLLHSSPHVYWFLCAPSPDADLQRHDIDAKTNYITSEGVQPCNGL